jgi:integrase
MRLTDRTIAALPSPERGQKLYTDDALPGFGVRVGKGRTFVLTVGTDRRRITIGRYIPGVFGLAQARQKAKTILAQRHLGLEKPASPRFEQVHEEFLTARESKLRAASYRKDMYRLRAFASLARKRIAEITPEEVQEIIDSFAAPSMRHEVLVRFTLLMRFAEKHRYVQNWPLDILEGHRKRIARERVLTDEELRTVLHTARMWRLGGHHFGTIVELLIYTGQRRQQIGSLDRSYVDFEEGTIAWPPELMKAGRRHTIPMGQMVREVLEPLRANGLYFPNKYGEPFTFAGAYDRAFRADCGFSDWVLHDLRRTMATRWQEMDIDITTTEKMLSHSAITGGLVGVYQKATYLKQMRAAVQRWELYVQALLLISEGTNV